MIPKKNRRLPYRRITRRRNVYGNSTRRRTILSRFRRSRPNRRLNYTGRRRTGIKRRRTLSRKGPVAKVLRRLFPINKFTYTTAQTEFVANSVPNDALGCRWFVPNRALDVSISYPNWTDMVDVANQINSRGMADNLIRLEGYSNQGNDFQFHTSNFTQTCKIVSQSNSQTVIECYTCTARRDIPMYEYAGNNSFNFLNILGHGFTVSNLFNDQGTGLPTLDPDNYVGDTTPFGTLSEALRDAALTPFSSTTFTKFFQISKPERRILDSGDMTTFTVSNKRQIANRPSQYKNLFQPNASWRYDGNVADLICVAPKGAKFLLFKMTGQIGHVNGATEFMKYSSPRIDMVTHVSFDWQYTTPGSRITYRSANFGIDNGNAPITIMNEKTGVSVAEGTT